MVHTMSPMERPEDAGQVFLLANDVGWTGADLDVLRGALELLFPIGGDAVRIVPEAPADTSTLLVGMGPHLETFLDVADADVGERFLQPLLDAVRRHDAETAIDDHHVRWTGIHRDVKVSVVVDGRPEGLEDAFPRLHDASELIDAILDRHDDVRRIEVAWEPAVAAWVAREVQLVHGEVLPGPIFGRA